MQKRTKLRVSTLLFFLYIFNYLFPKPRCLTFKPYAVVWRERARIHTFFLREVNAVARANERGESNYYEHKRAEVAVLHRMTVLVASYSRRASFIYYKEKPEVDAAPVFADLKIVAIAVLFRLVPAQSQGEGRNKPE